MPSHQSERSSSSSRDRLLGAAKRLFAAQGYEQSATSAIAREAGTSESQLMRYFGGKVGLLEALFDEAWKHLNARAARVVDASLTPRDAILDGLQAVVTGLGRDRDLAMLFMFEGRRVRGEGSRVRLSRGFVHFAETIRTLVRQAQGNRTIDQNLDVNAVTWSILGATEAMIRERLVAKGGRAFAEREIRRTLEAMLDGFAGGGSRTPRRGRAKRSAR